MTRKRQEQTTDNAGVRRIFLYVLAGYLLLVVLFYFLAGDQLHYRATRGAIEMPAADAASMELSDGAAVEQVFTAKIDRIENIGVQFGTYYRTNAGTLTMELRSQSDGEVLLRQDFDVASIAEGQIAEMTAETLIENSTHAPLVLRLTADSESGMGVTPLISLNEKVSEDTTEQSVLLFNGEAAEGALCFSASGEDYIWTGRHYWKFALGLGVLLAAVFFAVIKRYKAGKRSYLISSVLALEKYRFLIDQLVARDFKTRYKRSVLGMFWSVLNPLLTMMVQYFVFSKIFKNDVPNFAVYLLIGVVMFSFFSESTGLTLTSILGNAGLITKVYMPKYIYPLTRTLSSLVNLALSLIPLAVMCLATGVEFKKSAILALHFFVCLVIFTLGLGMLLATSMVFFRDTQFLWSVLSLMWMYATPIFYPERILPDNLKIILEINPLYYFIKNARVCILDGISPEPTEYFLSMAVALGMLLIGALVFRRHQDKFVLYL